MSEFVVEADNLGKCYRIYDGPLRRVVESATLGRVRGHRPFWALRGVSFGIKPGGSLGLCGANGAGKSTLLKVLAGTTSPSEGRFRVGGRVSSLLELGAGFHLDFTGRANIVMNGIMMGFSKREMESKIDEIVEFAELGEYIDEPVRTYSSGMGLRLGFSVAMAVEPDVMIMDEVFAVGDMYFQKKCVDKVYELKQRNKTLIFCSHSLYDVRQLCDDAIWLRDGKPAVMGESVVVTNEYSSYQAAHIAEHEEEGKPSVTTESTGPRVLPRVVDARIYRAGTDAETHQIFTGDSIEVRIWWKNPTPERTPIQLGIALFGQSNVTMAGFATHFDSFEVKGRAGCSVAVLPNVDLLSGNFLVGVILFDGKGTHQYQQYLMRENLLVRHKTREVGYFRLTHHWEDRSGLAAPDDAPRIREGLVDGGQGRDTGETGGWQT